MSGGYYRIHRSSWDDDDYAGDEFSRREAWFWLIGQAAWKPRQTTVGGRVINLERGQCAFSLRYLATAWGWSVKRVRTFIKAGTASAKIGHETGTRYTLITICNYDKYQADAPNEGTTGAQQGHNMGTNKKKERRKEGEDSPPIAPPKGGPKKATALPDDWQLPDNFLAFALGEGWTESEARYEADCFRDYWHGVGGQRGRKADWLATWRNWIRRANRPRPGTGTQRGGRGRVSEALERLQAEGDRERLDGGRNAPAGYSQADMGAGRGQSPAKEGAVVDLFPVRSGGSGARTFGDDASCGFEAGRSGGHDRALRPASDRVSAAGGFGSGFRLGDD